MKVNTASPNIAQQIAALSSRELDRLEAALTPKLNQYMPHKPTSKQAAFLLLNCREAFYGGACGGGKSDAILMAALQYVDIPGYAAIIFRQSYSDLSLPGALMDRAADWLKPFTSTGEVRWHEKSKTYIFQCPGGGESTLSFGYLETDTDKYRYQSAEFQFIGYDELTQILESCYRYLFSRLRRLLAMPVPLRVRSASNPGGAGHEWVKRRFITDGKAKGRVFISAKLEDNPYLDLEEYETSLNELDIITRAQLRSGNWDVKSEGSIFDRNWFEIVEPDAVPKQMRTVRFWDCAATDPKNQARKQKASRDPDYTTGCHLGEAAGVIYILDMRRLRKRPRAVEAVILRTAQRDNATMICMEQEPGSAGIAIIEHFVYTVLAGYPFKGVPSTGSKHLRAVPVSTAAEHGMIKIVRGTWNSDLFDELEAFPGGEHDDQVDALSGAYNQLAEFLRSWGEPYLIGEDHESYWLENPETA